MSYKIPGLDKAVSVIEGAASRAAQQAVNQVSNKATQVLSDAINKKVGNLLDFSNTGIGKALGKVGISADFGQFISGPGAGGWHSKAAARGDPMLQIDWYPVMPFGLAPEFVESISVPKSNPGQSAGVFMAGRRVYFADVIDTASVSVVLFENQQLTAHQYVKNWKARISNSDGTRNPPAVYKQPIILIAMDVKGNTIGRIIMNGCWPQTEGNYEATSGSSERVTVTLEFSCDSVDVEVAGAALGSEGIASSMSDVFNSFLQGGIAKIGNAVKNVAQAGISRISNFL